MNKPDILFIHLGAHSFVKEDLKILGELTNVHEFFFNPKKARIKPFTLFILLWNFIQQFFWLLINIRKAKLIYCWFSDYHGFLPALFSKLTGKPLVTVLGGFDCIKMPHLGYGIFCSSWRKPIGEFVIRNSELLLPVDYTLIESNEIAKNWPDAHPNGLKFNIKNFNTPVRTMPTGYASDVWKSGEADRKKIVSTVAGCSTMQIAYRKGLDLFIESAKLLPDFKFIIVGPSSSLIHEIQRKFDVPSNVEILPRQKREDLNAIYTSSSVYTQLSRAEGLPNVLCEAMMCGCIPVGSPVFGIPECIKNTGFVAHHPDPKEIAVLIENAHSKGSEQTRREVRDRIQQEFTLENRRIALQEVLKNFNA